MTQFPSDFHVLERSYFFLSKLAQMKSISQVNFAFYFIMLKIGFCLKCLIRCQIICDVEICSKCPQFCRKKTLSIYSSFSSLKINSLWKSIDILWGHVLFSIIGIGHGIGRKSFRLAYRLNQIHFVEFLVQLKTSE